MSKLSMQIQNRKLKSVSMVYGQSVFVFYLDMFRFHRGKNLFSPYKMFPWNLFFTWLRKGTVRYNSYHRLCRGNLSREEKSKGESL